MNQELKKTLEFSKHNINDIFNKLKNSQKMDLNQLRNLDRLLGIQLMIIDNDLKELSKSDETYIELLNIVKSNLRNLTYLINICRSKPVNENSLKNIERFMKLYYSQYELIKTYDKK